MRHEWLALQNALREGGAQLSVHIFCLKICERTDNYIAIPPAIRSMSWMAAMLHLRLLTLSRFQAFM